MEVLLRHTILGDGLRSLGLNHLSYPEEHDSGVLKRFTTLQDAQSHEAPTGENTPLLSDRDHGYDSNTLLVDWYGDDDSEVSIIPCLELR